MRLMKKNLRSVLFHRGLRKCKFIIIIYIYTSIDSDKNIFSENPLKNDSLMRQGQERYEKARIEKKLKELIKEKGYNCLKKINNFEDLVNEMNSDEIVTGFKFENENYGYKNNFKKFNHRASKDSGNNESLKSTYKSGFRSNQSSSIGNN